MSNDRILFIRFYMDEDVHGSIGLALRQRGYDALTVREANRSGLSDAEQLAYAAAQDRVLFSFNAADYIALHLEYLAQGREHTGIVISCHASKLHTIEIEISYFLKHAC